MEVGFFYILILLILKEYLNIIFGATVSSVKSVY